MASTGRNKIRVLSKFPFFPKQLHEKDLLNIYCAGRTDPMLIVYHILEYKKPNNVEAHKKFPGKSEGEKS